MYRTQQILFALELIDPKLIWNQQILFVERKPTKRVKETGISLWN
jgi:hypothetical protein